MGAAFSWQATVRPVFVRVIRPASDKTSRCFITAGSDIEKGSASALTETLSSLLRRARSARRVGSARAAKVRSRAGVIYLTIRLSVRPRPSRRQAVRAPFEKCGQCLEGAKPPGASVFAKIHKRGMRKLHIISFYFSNHVVYMNYL